MLKEQLAAASQNPLIPKPTELIIGAIAFFIVFGALGKVLLPRIQKTLTERTDKIEGGLQRAEELQLEAQRALEEYQARIAEARQEAARLREQAREEGAQIIVEMREQAQAEARRLLEAAESQLDAERQQALTALRTDVGALAVELASRIVGESLADETRRTRVVDRFLDEIERESGAAELRG
ncbi:MAG TPA: F0F1 ATP synthase subunit B [Streptosporangiaceae bacterium]|nr:F0F1 ATP synthase subunit B [Streptosporangiaceae bacterium]